MLLIRPVRLSDLDDLYQMAELAGKGMTSLPTDRATLTSRVERSEASFARRESDPDDFFLLGLEDTQTRQLMGTAGCFGKTGNQQAFYAYRVMAMTHFSHALGHEVRSDLLHLSNDYTDCSEVGALFLKPEYRGNGRALATARYVLMTLIRERFADHVIAELRGWTDDRDESPLWDAIGQHFFQMSYEEADFLCATGSNQFITELMPRHPIYTCLLPKSAQDVIGKPNRMGEGAMAMLQSEGFIYDNVVDIFDGGPVMRAATDQIKSVASARDAILTGHITYEQDASDSEHWLVSTTDTHCPRMIETPVHHAESSISLPASSIEALELEIGDTVIYTPLTRRASS